MQAPTSVSCKAGCAETVQLSTVRRAHIAPVPAGYMVTYRGEESKCSISSNRKGQLCYAQKRCVPAGGLSP